MTGFLPLRFLLATNARWVDRHQTQVLEYLVEENRVLEEQLPGKRLRLTDDPRRRLAANGRIPGCRRLARIATIVTPDTITRRHEELIAGMDFFTVEVGATRGPRSASDESHGRGMVVEQKAFAITRAPV